MWLIFFDLDQTLFYLKDHPVFLSESQLSNTNTAPCYSIPNQNTGDGQPEMLLLQPIYWSLHKEFFNLLYENKDNCSIFFITAGSYYAQSLKPTLANMLTDNSEEKKDFIEHSTFINASILMRYFPQNLDWSDRNAYLKAFSDAKAQQMESSHLRLQTKKLIPAHNVILVDDSVINRSTASMYGYQVIDPTREDYKMVLQTLIHCINSNSIFSNPHNR
ncbi:hypothetical protein [Pelagibaculum spongiae]|uniref:FCP1 homology domain-containing protein n=1 Tax=Pelagibaculum spongiae TaxID=2080658 RepID=A0A2V1GX93_9GAMM|nr:hypothetical protein [Pelagibaculum spongiae]PVZ71714.1 hypothetical protein DC094_01420 [Pelagibaculum spongiae]